MQANQFLRLIVLLCYTIACVNKNSEETPNEKNVKDSPVVANTFINDTIEAGKVIAKVFCSADTSQSYAVYLPVKGKTTSLPVIYFFDPHGDGSFPLGKYKSLADKYDFILIGSNNSRNGNDWPSTENVWNTLFNDTQKRLKINADRIYTCGFSGGAKVAGYIGLGHNEVKGVIANGAGLPDATPAGNYHFSFTAITGEGDMNMTDLVAMSADLDKTETRHRIIFFNGKHEWAPLNTMDIAFSGLQLDAIRQKLIQADDVFIDHQIVSHKKNVTVYLEANNYTKAESECKLSISLFDGITNEVNWFREKEAFIQGSPAYQKQRQSEQNLLAVEQNMKAVYAQQLQQGDRDYWSKTIAGLQAKAKIHTAEGGMYQRLLAYLSLAFYSVSNQLIKSGQNKEASYFVDLYKMADADNSEAWYFSALLNARNNNAKATADDLLKAVANGFSDKNRLMQQPEFQSLATQINLTEICNKMRKR